VRGFAYHRLEPRIDSIDRTYFNIGQLHAQADLANDVFGNVGRDFRRFLGSWHPDEAGSGEERHQGAQAFGGHCSLGYEDMGGVDRRSEFGRPNRIVALNLFQGPPGVPHCPRGYLVDAETSSA
jgi:hypothetical protein